ncbi:hypothetical protein FA15DRAFT_761117 [Coprinopsis marcescibilis]|uniref:Uncharacterized protein n=1 Tax=Coprinopsis marcescibilis TaxID=230819 RepID=A0A5C3KCD0_COPMA|nr:hypothetical protein FA15DRAFT_761117 [Coprinopsis marcescibilis]
MAIANANCREFTYTHSHVYGNRGSLRLGNVPTMASPKFQQPRVPSTTPPSIPSSPLQTNHILQNRSFVDTDPAKHGFQQPRIPSATPPHILTGPLPTNQNSQNRNFIDTYPPQHLLPVTRNVPNAHRPTQAPLHRFPSFLPAAYPPHIESIFADEFSRTYDTQIPKPSPRPLLYQFKSELATHLLSLGVLEPDWPTKYSYAFFRVRGQGQHVYTHLGVSTTYGNYSNDPNMATAVRCRRIQQCWGDQIPPRPKEGWKHGQCAETQSLPAVVSLCEQLGLTDSPVIIHSFAINKRQEPSGMCGNCLDYVHARIVLRYRKWTVVDMAISVAYNSVRGPYVWQG